MKSENKLSEIQDKSFTDDMRAFIKQKNAENKILKKILTHLHKLDKRDGNIENDYRSQKDKI